MNERRRIAVLDIGKTNAKVLVLDCETGVEIAERRVANRVLSGPPYPHYDVEALWAFIVEALKAFAASPGYDAISITAHGAAAALLDEDGELALPVLDYEHIYPAPVAETYAGMRPPFSETFSPALSGGLNLGAQLHYQKTVFPSEFRRVRSILTYPQYWAFRLTGVVATEVTSLGCHTDLWRPDRNEFSSLVDRLGLRSMMAPVRSAFDPLGPVLPALEIGLGKSVEVFCGIHDSNASLLPHLSRPAPFAVVSSGTWVVSFAVGGDIERLDPARDTLANVDAYGRAVPSSRFMGGREFEMLTAELGPCNADAALAAMPAVLEAGMMLLPNVAEGSGPFPMCRRRWLGDAGASSGERWAAACLYLAMMTDVCLGLIGAKGPILLEGPLASNPAFLSALRMLGGRPVIAVGGTTGTSQGAGCLAGVALRMDGREIAEYPALSGIEQYRQRWVHEVTAHG
ncbi:MAG TPA: FGGY-family carbohydrate kinase [Pseudorhizobium sp.]|nr:FGGY-family carbohydrate kinase [Pseudorhizobium sp.]